MTLSATDPGIAITILHVPDCPNVETLRKAVERALTTLNLRASVEEIEGGYPSPTLLVNGIDVIPRPGPIEAACRLDLPTDAQILDALALVRRKNGDLQVGLGPSATDDIKPSGGLRGGLRGGRPRPLGDDKRRRGRKAHLRV
jgi:hypothetical protein